MQHTPAHTLDWPDDGGLGAESISALPARRGVVVFRSSDHQAVTIVVTADVRRLARSRLGQQAPAESETADGTQESAPAADLRPVTRGLDVYLAGSALEADLVFLDVARGLLPRVYRAATDRWRAWCMRLDPAAPMPTWKEVRLGELDVTERAPRTLVGPFRDKDAAGRYGEALDDLFELCRYPRELAQAPRGTPCVYKEMGRCPAACDGSEPMHSYRARAERAIDLSPEARAAGAVEANQAMQAAAATQQFELAARQKDRAARFAALTKPAFAHADRLDRARWLAVLPSERRGWVRLIAVALGRWRPIADVDPAGEAVDAAIAEADHWLERQRDAPIADDASDAMGLLASYLYGRPKISAGALCRRTPKMHVPGACTPDVRAAIRSAARVKDDASGGSTQERDRELTGD
ncbi:MAG: hypothetical protein AAF138_08780 [Planctomycetota bacterium]